jgi:hypothetical protein
VMAEFIHQTALPPHINEQSFLPTSSITRSGAVPAGSPALDMISGPPPPTSSANNVSHPLQPMIKIEDPLTPSLSPPTQDPGTPTQGQAEFPWMKEKKTARKQSQGKRGESVSLPPVTRTISL